MTGFTQNNRGRYKCDFCDHSTYKTMSGVLTHVQGNHELELAKATAEGLRAELDRERRKPPKVVEKERVVYRDPPKKEKTYWYLPAGHGIYCESCKEVQIGVGIPEGQTIENTPHHCGNRTLKLVVAVR